MKTLFILWGCLVATSFALGQNKEILAYGRVVDGISQKGLMANIEYKSIPTGSIHGEFNDSTYSFRIFGTAKYRLNVEARGYHSASVIIDPKDIDPNNSIVNNITLIPHADKIVLSHLIFQQGKAEIQPSSFTELDAVAAMMLQNKKMVIQLEGHTDNVGNADANLELSQKRVLAVKKYLASQGVEKDRVKTKAFGGSQPLKNEMTPEARAMNRRVEMRILKN